jgi:anti-sigma factor RsiW
MSDHLSPVTLNALADGELAGDSLAQANEHLGGCSSCTTSALHQSLLKSATARAGQRYTVPADFQERLMHLAAAESSRAERVERRSPVRSSGSRWGMLGWVTAAVLLFFFGSAWIVQRNLHKVEVASVEHAALVSEVFDQHVATLAASLAPQVVSTDRHTVKPWFQGKIPFSFNLPENLPRDTTLDGANLTYLRNQAVAQLLYSIGKHRVSVFVSERPSPGPGDSLADHSGFHVMDFSAGGLEMVAVSDVDPARLAELADAIRRAQAENQQQRK